VKQMREEADVHGNLFHAEGSGGIGYIPAKSNKNGRLDFANMSIDEYQKVRKQVRGA
jgi:hypothetical protein